MLVHKQQRFRANAETLHLFEQQLAESGLDRRIAFRLEAKCKVLYVLSPDEVIYRFRGGLPAIAAMIKMPRPRAYTASAPKPWKQSKVPA
jgi:hypothetical protein